VCHIHPPNRRRALPDPSNPSSQELLGQGITLHRQGQIAAAECIYTRLLKDEPHSNSVRHLLGLIRYGQKRYSEALDLIAPVASANPMDLEAQSNLGNVLKAVGRLKDALASYDRALAIDAKHAAILNNRGLVLADLRRFEDALASYNQALIENPSYVEALFNQGLTLWHMHRYEQALASYDKAVSLFPGYAEAWNNRGNVLRQLNRPAEALMSYERAWAADRNNLYALGNIAFLTLYLCDWVRAEKIEEALIDQIRAGSGVVSPFVLLGYSSDPALQLECAKTYSRDRLPSRPAPIWQGQNYQHHRIRIAYMSSDFRQHAMSYLIVGMLENHDRSRFEIIGISLNKDDGSDIRKRIVRACDRFEDVDALSDEDVARLLHALEIDILIDLNGYTDGCRPEILAYRSVPIQVGYLGYPATTGCDLTDYIIADDTTLPFAMQPFFTERIVHLPECYLVNDSRRVIGESAPSRQDEGLPENGFVFCSFSNGWKIKPLMFDVWMRLLKSVPDSVLWLIETNAVTSEHIRREARSRGVGPERIVIAKRVAPQAHLARHCLVDLAIDTLPYNGHTTVCDALWMGVPVVTMWGESFSGRVAASLLAAVGMQELITETLTDYEALALKLARDPVLIQSVRSRLGQNRLVYPLFDTKRFCRHIEAAFIQMQQWSASGLPSRSFRATLKVH
jgi:protein O-GlcNAc transferase